jgi:hypothetical protein
METGQFVRLSCSRLYSIAYNIVQSYNKTTFRRRRIRPCTHSSYRESRPGKQSESIEKTFPENDSLGLLVQWGMLFEEIIRVLRPGGSVEMIEDGTLFDSNLLLY